MAGEATRTIRLRVEGMGCDGCVTSVARALQAVPGVTRAEVDLARGTAEVEALPAIEPARLIAAVDAAGYEAPSPEPMSARRFPGIHAVLYALFDARGAAGSGRDAPCRSRPASPPASTGSSCSGSPPRWRSSPRPSGAQVIEWAARGRGRPGAARRHHLRQLDHRAAGAAARRRSRRRGLADPAAAVGRRLSASELMRLFGRLADAAHAAGRDPERPGADGPGPERGGIAALVRRAPPDHPPEGRDARGAAARGHRGLRRARSSCSTARPAWR